MLSDRKKRVYDFFPQVNDRRRRFKLLITIEVKKKGRRSNKLKITDEKFTDFKLSEISPNLNQEKYSNIVNKAKEYIHDGDIFQVVLSRRFSFNAKGDFLKVYKILRDLNPSPYLYHVKMNDKITIGASPEICLHHECIFLPYLLCWKTFLD